MLAQLKGIDEVITKNEFPGCDEVFADFKQQVRYCLGYAKRMCIEADIDIESVEPAGVEAFMGVPDTDGDWQIRQIALASDDVHYPTNDVDAWIRYLNTVGEYLADDGLDIGMGDYETYGDNMASLAREVDRMVVAIDNCYEDLDG